MQSAIPAVVRVIHKRMAHSQLKYLLLFVTIHSILPWYPFRFRTGCIMQGDTQRLARQFA